MDKLNIEELTRTEHTLLGMFNIFVNADPMLEKLATEGLDEELYIELNRMHEAMQGAIKIELEYLLGRKCTSMDLFMLSEEIIPQVFLADAKKVH